MAILGPFRDAAFHLEAMLQALTYAVMCC